MNDQKRIKLAIIGASSFQNPLILKAKERGIETHVFAWENGDIGERTADYFYPISITDKDAILDQCRQIGIDGVASIGSDLANITVAYVANALDLCSNSIECVARSTDKSKMRRCFEEHGDPSPRSIPFGVDSHINDLDVGYPIIVKPSDRSGSRGISFLSSEKGLMDAIEHARDEGFSDTVLIEEFAQGREFSIESITWQGHHSILALTEKFTTGAPGYIETAHLEPGRLDMGIRTKVYEVVESALDHLGVEYGASHSEVKVADDGSIKIIEIGSRMGGDCIGSDLVQLSTGYDFVNAVIDVALGVEPECPIPQCQSRGAAVRFIFSEKDVDILDALKNEHQNWIKYESEINLSEHEITDSSSRLGFFIFSTDDAIDLIQYLPNSNSTT